MKTVFLFFAMMSTLWAQSEVEQNALKGVQQMMQSGQGRVSFSGESASLTSITTTVLALRKRLSSEGSTKCSSRYPAT
jgi:hypothetical protein